MICERCNKEHDGSFGSGRFCSRACANARARSEETKRKIRESVEIYNESAGKVVWSKVQPTQCKLCNNDLPKGNSSGYCHSCSTKRPEVREKISKANKGKTGGFRNYGGNGKSGIYKGFLCQSSWELAWLIYQLDNGVNVQRNKEYFEYIVNGTQKKYYPDFVVDGVYYEIKGKRFAGFDEKLACFPKDKVLVLVEGKTAIKPYIDYCTEKYGDFCSLYDRRW
jgi:hypothetical protein